MQGYRNTSLGICYMITCLLLAYWSKGQITDLGGTFGSLGLGVTGVVAGRAANKWAENGHEKGGA